jgi:2-polyprenyl-6-methoxyphenol hydroxylase-like FAD-dependent oxidoreductase
MEANTSEQAPQKEGMQSLACCIVGGGPAGMILAYMLARQEIPVTLLEAHMDFNRDFRGNTVSPATLTILDELGLADRLLAQIPHAKWYKFNVRIANETVALSDFSLLHGKYPYMALIPQVSFLSFLAEEAKRYPCFHLIMGAQVDRLIEEDGKICGVGYRGQDGRSEVRAPLVVGADGRFSRVRKLGDFKLLQTAPPIDVLWFKLSRKASDQEEPLQVWEQGRSIGFATHFDCWQIAYMIPKGTYQQVRADGLERLCHTITDVAPWLSDRVDELQDWQQISVLSVESSYVARWHRPGLLLIGDAAHPMSPVGGVGINFAIQDAVVAANILSKKLKQGTVGTRDLARVQRQRQLPTRLIQGFQKFIQERIHRRILNENKTIAVSPIQRILARTPIVPYFTSYGLRKVHVKQ